MKLYSQLFVGSAIASLMASPAWSQDQEALNADKQATSPTASDIVVTGTRISRAGYEAPTPLTVISGDDLIRKAPGPIADALNQLPAFQNSINASQQAFGQSVRQRSGNYLNLRALGTNRVLVLQDGQRLPPTGNNGGVDTNQIPQQLTQRIDVVTGGVSAVYGSDAVSGVVNFILDRRLEGIKALAQSGVTFGGYNSSQKLAIAGGQGFIDDKLHLVVSAEYYNNRGVKKTDKPIVGMGYLSTGSGTAANPFKDRANVRFATYSDTGKLITVVPTQQFLPNGDLTLFDPGISANRPGYQIGGSGAMVSQCCQLIPTLETTQLFASADYEADSGTRGYLTVGYNFGHNDSGSKSIRNATIFRDNAYLTPSTLAAIGSAPSFNFGRVFPFELPNTQKSALLLITGGIEGKIGESIKWRVAAMHGKTTFTSSTYDFRNSAFYAATDAVRNPANGQIVCRVTLVDPSRYPGCIPVNIMGISNFSREAIDYIADDARWNATNVLDSIQANLSGDLFALPAGNVSYAVGGEYRHLKFNQTSNSDPTVKADFTNLRGVLLAGNLIFGTSNVGIGKGSYTVKELFGELVIPVLKESAIGSLEASGAARLTDYSTSGSVVTWKVGGIYDPVHGIRFRATFSRDIRAPTPYELFAGQTEIQISISDILTGQSGGVGARAISGGNPNLTPEVARTLTGGVVITPAAVPGLSFSADYFDINIKNAINTPFTPLQVIDLCAASNFTSPVCNQIVRPFGPTNTSPANTPTAILVYNANLSSLRTRGVDFETSYSFPLLSGRLSLRALATRLLKFDQTNAPGQATTHYAGTADYADLQFNVALPKWRANASATLELGAFLMSIQQRYIGPLVRSKLLVYEANRIPSVMYTDLNLSLKQDFGGAKSEFFATVNNLFNKKPPLIPVGSSPGATYPTIRSTYDIVGTVITVGFRASL